MSILTVVTPNQTKVQLAVSDNTLVFTGETFIEPENATQVALYTQEVNALSEFKGSIVSLITGSKILASVVSFDPTPQPTTDGSVVEANDPSEGKCVCGVTCKGTLLAYVQVNYLQE